MLRVFILIFVFSCAHQPFKKYDRKEWNHWVDVDRDCQNTRHEILIARTLGNIRFDRKRCNVIKGLWQDYYYPETHTLARAVDIDHLVPLKNAHDTGGAHWDQKQKEKFANDPDNLVITKLSYNRKKGSKGIDGWLPVHKDYACKYIKDWVKIKQKYRLNLTPKEVHSITQAGCP